MRNFLKIADGVDVLPVLSALAADPKLWNANKIRTTHESSPHRAVDDILVFFNRVPDRPEEIVNDIQAHPCDAWFVLNPIKPMVLDLMRRVGGCQLGRVIITRLPPGKMIEPHVDMGAPADFYQRYHIVLQSGPGCIFHAGDEAVAMSAGEVWWFDNQQEHRVINNSADDRIVIVVDLRVV